MNNLVRSFFIGTAMGLFCILVLDVGTQTSLMSNYSYVFFANLVKIWMVGGKALATPLSLIFNLDPLGDHPITLMSASILGTESTYLWVWLAVKIKDITGIDLNALFNDITRSLTAVVQ
jgi:hypothetical protein